MDDLDILQEFLIESAENLTRLDQEMVELEKRPHDRELLASIFRTIHTIKGTCGFLGFQRLESITHRMENILGELRAGRRLIDQQLTTLILDGVDAVKSILSSIESAGGEPEGSDQALLRRLDEAFQSAASDEVPSPAESPVPASEQVAPPAPPDDAAQRTKGPDSTVRVDVGLLDRLMNQVGELVLTRNQFIQYSAGAEDPVLQSITQRLNLTTSELQQGVLKTRMQPVGVLWNKLPRLVRDLAASLNKQIELRMEGAETELDRTLLEAIRDPLTHIVRNSCDHGIEDPEARACAGKRPSGTLFLRAYHKSGHVNLEISDDGAGIDPQRVKAKALEKGVIRPEQADRLSERDAINLIFLPGFSTATSVTNLSGRGVGMDVVRTHIEAIGGTVDVSSVLGQGTVMRLRIPLTLAIVSGLVVSSGGERFVIPQVSLDELIRLEGPAARNAIEYVRTTPVYRHRGALLPVADLNDLLRLTPGRSSDELSIVILRFDDVRFGLLVDSIRDTQEIVVKPLGPVFKNLHCYAGATIMGDGGIALILDVPALAARSGVFAASKGAERFDAAAPVAEEKDSLLLFSAGPFRRLAMPLNRVTRLENFDPASIELAAGQGVVQYRGSMLPLVDLSSLLGAPRSEKDFLSVIVLRSEGGDLGFVVDEILDIVEEFVICPQPSDHPAVAGFAIVGGAVTDFLDLSYAASSVSSPATCSITRLEAVLRRPEMSLEWEGLAR